MNLKYFILGTVFSPSEVFHLSPVKTNSDYSFLKQKIMKKIIFGVFISAFMIACSNEKTEDKPAASSDATAATASDKKTTDELLALSDGDGVKSAMDAFANRDVDGMTASYADDIMYRWSGGDSLVGKQAVKDYYNGRLKLIDSLSFTDHVILPVKVNNVQTPYQLAGKWVLHWAFAHVKYKTGKKINFWIHNDYHYNDAGKVDLAIQYIDMHPIREASK